MTLVTEQLRKDTYEKTHGKKFIPNIEIKQRSAAQAVSGTHENLPEQNHAIFAGHKTGQPTKMHGKARKLKKVRKERALLNSMQFQTKKIKLAKKRQKTNAKQPN